MVSKDVLWKGIIEDLVEDFLHFFFPEHVHEIDFERGFTFLDKELEQLSPQSESQNRHADKLIRAYLKTGEEQWFLIHVEVQGYNDPDFAFRMYQYAYRIRDRYHRSIVALAIFTNTNPRYHYSEYQEEFWGTEIIYRYRAFIIMSHTSQSLRRSGNLFGLAMEVARREMMLNNKRDEERFDIKMKLVRHLIKLKVERNKIRKLLNFIKFYIPFEEHKYFHKFEEDIQELTKSRQAMGIEEAILEEFKKQGLEQGLEKGLEQGLEQGLEKGLEKGREESIRNVISRAHRKGLPLEDIADLVALPIEEVEAIIEEQMDKEGENT